MHRAARSEQLAAWAVVDIRCPVAEFGLVLTEFGQWSKRTV